MHPSFRDVGRITTGPGGIALAARRFHIGRRLVERSLEVMREREAMAVETIYDAWSEPSSELWHRAGFAPWMVHACKML